MKLFVIAALVAVAAAGRLEHLERSYLPPDNNAVGSARSTFGSNGGFGSPSSHGNFGSRNSQGSFGPSSGAFGAAGAGLQRQTGSASFAGATSNQYLPPNQRSASNAAPQFAGSIQGFGAQNIGSQQFSSRQVAPAQQYAAPNTQYGSPQATNSFNAPSSQAQYPQQSVATSRQYLAPRTSSLQNPSQQAFDEQTGYQYRAPQGSSSISGPRYQGQFSQQPAAASRQYLAPRTSSFPFDEQTGYQY